jgi:phage-related protein
MYRIRFYRTRRGEAPVETYLEGVHPKHRRKILQHLELLGQEGPNLRRPYADVLRGPLRELRVSLARLEHRVLYYFVKGDFVVLLHGFLKKTQAVPPQEIATAEARMKDLNARIQSGEVLE